MSENVGIRDKHQKTRLQPGQSPQRRQIRILLLPIRQNLRNTLIKALTRRTRPILPAAGAMYLALRDSSLIQTIRKIQNRFSTQQRLFMVILDIDIEDMNRPVKGTTLVHEVVDNSIPAALFAGDDDIDDAGFGAQGALVALGDVVDARGAGNPVLEALGAPFQLSVAVEHVQDAVCAVETLVFAVQLLVHLVVGGRVEAVDVWLGDRGAWETD